MLQNNRAATVDLARHAFGGQGELAVVAHGLLGSSRNWQALAKALGRDRRVLAVDLRNHGDSAWSDEMSYPAMAADLRQVILDAGAGPASLIGHSMGGKAAMACALLYPDVVRRLVVVDIAPVEYHHGFEAFIDAMLGADLKGVVRRAEVDKAIEAAVPDQAVRAFLLQNLDPGSGGGARWRPNLETLRKAMPVIGSWPDHLVTLTYKNPVLFIRGEKSDYIDEAQFPLISSMFPDVRHVSIAGASHWVHADAPGPFLDALRKFLNGP